jgi:hypothetical protein
VKYTLGFIGVFLFVLLLMFSYLATAEGALACAVTAA